MPKIPSRRWDLAVDDQATIERLRLAAAALPRNTTFAALRDTHCSWTRTPSETWITPGSPSHSCEGEYEGRMCSLAGPENLLGHREPPGRCCAGLLQEQQMADDSSRAPQRISRPAWKPS